MATQASREVLAEIAEVPVDFFEEADLAPMVRQVPLDSPAVFGRSSVRVSLVHSTKFSFSGFQSESLGLSP